MSNVTGITTYGKLTAPISNTVQTPVDAAGLDFIGTPGKQYRIFCQFLMSWTGAGTGFKLIWQNAAASIDANINFTLFSTALGVILAANGALQQADPAAGSGIATYAGIVVPATFVDGPTRISFGLHNAGAGSVTISNGTIQVTQIT